MNPAVANKLATSPTMKPETGKATTDAPRPSGRMAPPQMPDAWRGFLERFNQGGLEQPGIGVGWQAVSRNEAERRPTAGTAERT